MNRQRVLVVVVILFSILLTAPAAGAIDTEVDNSPVAAQAGTTPVNITQTMELTPETPGAVRVTTTVDTPRELDEFILGVPESARLIDVDGFSRTTPDDPTEKERYDEEVMVAWDQNTDAPSVTYEIDANKTNATLGSEPTEGYETVDTGDWALVRTPSTPHTWYGSKGIETSVNHQVAGPGVSTDEFTFLGDHEIRTRTVHGQHFRLVIPDAADLVESPTTILDNVAYASEQLQVGERDEEVVMIAAPTSEEFQWSHNGWASGSTFWVRDDSHIKSSNNVWIHEYVHTRQDFNATQDSNWFVEGSAEYYAALYTLQQEQSKFEWFENSLSRQAQKYDDVRLTETKAGARTQYEKGGLVAARTDQQIRLATNGTASLADIFERMNADTTSVSNEDFIEYVGMYGTDELASDVRAATTTSQSMSMWDRDGHKQAFGEEPYPPQSNQVETEHIGIIGVLLLISLVGSRRLVRD